MILITKFPAGIQFICFAAVGEVFPKCVKARTKCQLLERVQFYILMILVATCEYEVVGSRPRGRPKRTWLEVVQRDCQVRGLSEDDAMVRGRWRKMIRTVDK